MKLFVYGSLKKGGKYDCYLEEATLIAEHAVANGVLYDSGLGYPAMVLSGAEKVIGDIYEIPDELWPALDDLEGYTGGAETDLFNKLTITVEADGEQVEAIVYVAKNQKLLKTKVASGVWDVSQSLLV
ncbi:gamma-glutamylcyclotransferase family protein [Planococcus sp. N028]|uniref:Gamma-glutamylcyclotransferase family protein n=1 Tax=Planococcus shixiaomingii TaxID=3058393 RepID=A0ABT8N3W0_9BACL|nr:MULTISPECIES: gamma-glutamylcyclotransferase family protein [unclassified Planococcus (in: firmicutes)]MDN7242577.1 gamma-glutamylcyclotransferase family protein [Planococcus sp. N028]WKA54812.1 gamma-glutamylcyclotransferase family protein [Planococcus sp. N022]